MISIDSSSFKAHAQGEILILIQFKLSFLVVVQAITQRAERRVPKAGKEFVFFRNWGALELRAVVSKFIGDKLSVPIFLHIRLSEFSVKFNMFCPSVVST